MVLSKIHFTFTFIYGTASVWGSWPSIRQLTSSVWITVFQMLSTICSAIAVNNSLKCRKITSSFQIKLQSGAMSSVCDSSSTVIHYHSWGPLQYILLNSRRSRGQINDVSFLVLSLAASCQEKAACLTSATLHVKSACSPPKNTTVHFAKNM